MANKHPQPSPWVQTAGPQYMWHSCQAPWRASRVQSLVSQNNHTITTADWKWMVSPNKTWLSMSDHTHIRWRVATMVSQVGFRSLPAASTQHQWTYNTNISTYHPSGPGRPGSIRLNHEERHKICSSHNICGQTCRPINQQALVVQGPWG